MFLTTLVKANNFRSFFNFSKYIYKVDVGEKLDDSIEKLCNEIVKEDLKRNK